MTKSLTEQVEEILAGKSPEVEAEQSDDTMSPDTPEQADASELPEGELETETPDQPEQPSAFSLRAAVVKAGYNATDDTDEATLTEQLLARLKQLEEIASTRAAAEHKEEPKAPPAELPKPEPKPAAAPAASQPEGEKQRTRKLPPLQKPEPELNVFVEIDPKTNLAVPIEKYGELSKSAADRINAYVKESQRRANLAVDDPERFINETLDVDELVSQRVEAKLKAWREHEEAQAKQTQQQLSEQQQQQRITQWFEDKLPELYVVDEAGRPRLSPFDAGTFATTPRGKQFLQTFRELQELSPAGDPVKVLEKAYALSAIQTAAASPEPAKQAEEKKKAFVSKRKQGAPVPGNKPAATLADRINSGEKVSLMAALLADPANADNSALAALR